MANSYVRFVLFKSARFMALGADAGSVMYYEHDRQADAEAEGEAWLLVDGLSHPWYAVFGQQQDGKLVRVAGEDT